ncbi:hypothetical protein V7149_22280 [Bacillus sp. JJ1503]
MLKLKTAITVILSLLIVLALTGCYGKSNETSKPSSTPETK